MKKISLFVVCLSNFILSAQNLTLNQLLEIRSKNLGYAEEFLVNNNWDLMNASEADENDVTIVSFVFNKNYYPIKESSLIGLIYNSDVNDNALSLQIVDKTKYIEYINTIKKLGCELILNEVEDGKIIKVYKGATTTFEIRSSRGSDSISTIWTMTITTNERYYQMFLNKTMRELEDIENKQ